MPDNDMNMRMYRARKEALVEDEIENSQLYKNLMSTLANFPDIKFNISEMINAYMDLDQSNTNMELVTGNFNPIIQTGLIDDVIRGTIYTISKEENGLVLDDNGTVNIEETIKCRMMAQYNFLRDFDSLSDEQQQMLIAELGNDLGLEKVADIFVDHSLDTDKSFNWLNGSKTDLNRDFFEKVFSGILETADIQTQSFEKAQEMINTNEDQNNFDESRLDQFLEGGTGVISFMKHMHIILGKNFEMIDDRQESKDKITKSSYALSKYNINGKLDMKAMTEEYEAWKEKFAIDSRIKVIRKYYDKKAEIKGPVNFSDLPFEEKDLVLRSALMLFEDKNAPQNYRDIGLMTLLGIDPKLIKQQVDENGNVIPGSVVIDDKVFSSAFNGMRSEKKQYSLKEIREIYRNQEYEETLTHLKNLEEKERTGEILSREEYEDLALTTENDINELFLDMEEIDSKNEKHTESKVQQKLDEKLRETLSSITDEKGQELTYTKKLNTVMATYLRLKKSVTGFEFDIGNREANQKAFELLEEYIKQDPITFGRYISETTDENGNLHREITIKDSDLTTYQNDKNSSPSSKKNIENVNTVLESIRDVAIRELAKNSKFKERMSKDGLERAVEDVKDATKRVLKSTLIKVLRGDTAKAQEMINAVKNNQVYKGTRRGVYAMFRGAYGVTKLIGSVTSLKMLRPNERLALPSANHTLKVKDIDKIIDDTKNTNYISTIEELKLVDIALRNYDKATPKAKEVYEEEIKKMNLPDKYKDEETGEIDPQKAIAEAKKWKKRYLNQKRGEGIQDYTELRRKGLSFDEFTPEDKSTIFRSAVMAFMDENTNMQLKNLAGAIIEEINPQLLSINKAGELSLNQKKLMEFYNNIFSDRRKCKTIEELADLYKKEEDMLAGDKISRLQDQGLKSREEREEATKNERAVKRGYKVSAKSNKEAYLAISNSIRDIKVEENKESKEDPDAIEGKSNTLINDSGKSMNDFNKSIEASAETKQRINNVSSVARVTQRNNLDALSNSVKVDDLYK